MQQQPPLDYYFSAFSGSVFGTNKLAVRSHAIFFYLILSFIFPLGLWFFCSSLWITAVGVILFLLNHVIRLHAVDGRPINLALLTGFIFLFFYMSYCNHKKEQKKLIKESFFPILSSQYLFVLSIGLQPVIFIVSLFISSFWLLFDNKKDIFKKLFLSNIITGILTFPFYMKMWLFGRSAYKFKQISSESISSYIVNFDIFYFVKRYFLIFYQQIFFSFLILIMGLIIVMVIRKTVQRQTLIMLSSLILFPLVYDLVFNIGIIWFQLENRYIIVFSLFLILAVVFFLKEVYNYLKTKSWKVYVLLLVSILFLWNVCFQISVIKNKTQFHYPYKDNSVEKVYDYLKEKGEPQDIAVQISLTPIAVYRESEIFDNKIILYNPIFHPIIVFFYTDYHKSPPFFGEDIGDRIYYINWESVPKKEKQKVFFIALSKKHKWLDDKAYEILSGFMKGQKIGRFDVFERILSSQNREEGYKQFLSEVNQRTPKKYRGALYETLLYYAYKNRNRKEFNHLLQEYRDMEMALDEFLPNVNYPSRFELKRRVKYFENFDWDTDKGSLEEG